MNILQIKTVKMFAQTSKLIYEIKKGLETPLLSELQKNLETYTAEILYLSPEDMEKITKKVEIIVNNPSDKIYDDSLITFTKEVSDFLEQKKADFVGAIVDVFECFLKDKNIMLPSWDRDNDINDFLERGDYKTAEEVIENEGLASIYGEDYDEIESAVDYYLDNLEHLELAYIENDIYNVFFDMAKRVPEFKITSKEEEELKNQVIEEFKRWNYI